MGAVDAQKAMTKVPICTVEELASADAVIFGDPDTFRQHVRSNGASS